MLDHREATNGKQINCPRTKVGNMKFIRFDINEMGENL